MFNLKIEAKTRLGDIIDHFHQVTNLNVLSNKDHFPDLWGGSLETSCEDIHLNTLSNHFYKSSLWTENSYTKIDKKCRALTSEYWR